MSNPAYYTPERVGTLYAPDTQSAATAGTAAGLSKASEDTRRVYVLLVDMQVDFIHPDGALSVPGAVEDTKRMVDWLYAHAGDITKIAASIDSHYTVQIFHPPWWVNAEGKHPDPYTPISSDEVKSGVWKPLYEPEWSVEYVEKLEEQAKKTLMIWPFHTLIGTPGHSLVPAVYEAIAYHTAAREATPHLLMKGMIPKSEHYSMMEPEVRVEGHPEGGVKTDFLDEIASYDAIYVTGQAKSHCVLETVTSMMRYYPREIVEKIRVIEDGMSSVAHPEIDFEAMANEQYARFAENGLRLIKTDDGLV